MLIVYPDETAMWRCDRCGAHHSRRFVLLTAQKYPRYPSPPWGWSGDHSTTYCAHCIDAMRPPMTASER